MAFPSLSSTQTNTVESNGTTHGITFPSSVASGLLAVWILSFNDNVATTPPAGWTTLIDQPSGPSNSRGVVLAKVTDGTEDSTTVDCTTDSATQSAQTLSLFTDWGGAIADVEADYAAFSSATPDSPSLTPAWGSDDTTWMTALMVRTGSRTVSAYPTNYTANQTFLNTSTGSGGAIVTFATRENATATEDPPAWTLDASISSVAVTLGIKPLGGFTPNGTDSDVYFDEASSSSTNFNITSISDDTPEEGQALTISHTNANASGKTVTIDGGAVTLTSQDANTTVFDYPDIKSQGNRTLQYNVAHNIIESDAGFPDSVSVTPQLATGDEMETILSLGGMYLNPNISGVAVGDIAFGKWVSGSGTVDLQNGSIGSDFGGTFRLWLYDVSLGEWAASYADYDVYGLYPDSLDIVVETEEAALFVSPNLLPNSTVSDVYFDEAVLTSSTQLAPDSVDIDVYFDELTSSALNQFNPIDLDVSAVFDTVTSITAFPLIDIDTDRIYFTG